jgi:predicted Rossmann fold flavoprotein
MSSKQKPRLVVIGGGAAGFFTAITAAENCRDLEIVILERGKEFLSKVRISGGGRCNVTHSCFEPKTLVNYYPRGKNELLGPFHRFSPSDTIEWFESRGVKLKTEEDGRMFPITDNSETIIHLFMKECQRLGIQILTEHSMESLHFPSGDNPSDEKKSLFQIKLLNGKTIFSEYIMLATGSSTRIWELLSKENIQIAPQVPSLFTFHIKEKALTELMGLSVPSARIFIEDGSKVHTKGKLGAVPIDKNLDQIGPLLITHWGVSGPAVLKLSAWGAHYLAEQKYKASLRINWVFPITSEEFISKIEGQRKTNPSKQVQNSNILYLPQRLWQYLIFRSGITQERWADLSKEKIQSLVVQCTECPFLMNGKSTFKEEFVTAGGVDLKQVDFKHFCLKQFPNMYIAGEMLNIDALTGGFNFQAAWTGGHIAGMSIAEKAMSFKEN